MKLFICNLSLGCALIAFSQWNLQQVQTMQGKYQTGRLQPAQSRLIELQLQPPNDLL